MPSCAVLTNDLQYDLVNKNDDRKQAVTDFQPRFSGFLDDTIYPTGSSSKCKSHVKPCAGSAAVRANQPPHERVQRAFRLQAKISSAGAARRR